MTHAWITVPRVTCSRKESYLQSRELFSWFKRISYPLELTKLVELAPWFFTIRGSEPPSLTGADRISTSYLLFFSSYSDNVRTQKPIADLTDSLYHLTRSHTCCLPFKKMRLWCILWTPSVVGLSPSNEKHHIPYSPPLQLSQASNCSSICRKKSKGKGGYAWF